MSVSKDMKAWGRAGQHVLTSNGGLIAFAERVGVHSTGLGVALGTRRAREMASGVQGILTTVFLLFSRAQRI